MMGRMGGGIWGRSKIAAAAAAALALAACASASPSTIYDLTAATPSSTHGLRAQIRIGQPTATADLDGDRILVRETPITLATLSGAVWPEPLPALFKARLAQSFVNAGLGHAVDGPAASADYEVDLDIRAFEFDAETKEAHLDIAAWIVSLGSGRIIADEIFTLRAPVASTAAPDVAAALDEAASAVMTQIIKFVAKTL
jgi:cholesterol transport system auxiliary component